MASPALLDIGQLISRTPGVNGGRPTIAGSRIAVAQVAAMYRDGLDATAIANEYPHIDLARIHAALAFYLANQQAVDDDLTEEAAAMQAAIAPDS
jgi:uncharacterized protein (DUF433 family)